MSAMESTVEAEKLSSIGEDLVHPIPAQCSDQQDPLALPAPSTKDISKAQCFHCGRRFATDGCTQNACRQCCTDGTCDRHKKAKEHAVWKEQILTGTTDVQAMAARIRSKLIPSRRFRESGFVYQGDTIIIFDIREYLSNDRWRLDAIRKCRRRRGGTAEPSVMETCSANSRRTHRKRFNNVMGALLDKSLNRQKL